MLVTEVAPAVNGGPDGGQGSATASTGATPKKAPTPHQAATEEPSTSSSSGQPLQALPQDMLPPIVENCSERMTSDEDSLRHSDLFQADVDDDDDDDALA